MTMIRRGIGGWFASPVRVIVTLISLIPAVLVALVIAQKGVNVPRWDQWTNSVDMVLHTASGQFNPSDLFYQNFEPRLLLANIITVILTLTTHWNLYVEMGISFVIVCINFLLLLALIHREHRRITVWAIIPLSLLIFSLRQHSNWLWSLQTSWFLMFLFFLLALLILQRSRVGWKAVILTALMTIGSTWSMFQGLALWILLPVLMLMYGYRKPAFYLFWLAVMALTLGLYFSNYNWSLIGLAPTTNKAADTFYLNPLGIAAYVGAYLGNPFVPTLNEFPPLARVITVIGLMLLAFNAVALYLWKRRLSTLALWAGLVGFAFANAIMSSFGRASDLEIAPWLPLLDRYVTPASLLWIALVVTGLIVIWRVRHRAAPSALEKVLVGLNVLVFIGLTVGYVYANRWASTQPPLISETNEQCVLRYPETRNAACMTGLWLNYMSLDRILGQIDELAAHRLTIFADNPPPYTGIIQLRRQPRVLAVGDKTASGFRFAPITDTLNTIVLALPTAGQMVFTVTLPQTDQAVKFYSAASVDTTAGASGAVNFTVGVRDPNGDAHVVGKVTYPAGATAPVPIRVDLGAYKGQTIQLLLQVTAAQSGQKIASRWVDPVIFVMAPAAP